MIDLAQRCGQLVFDAEGAQEIGEECRFDAGNGHVPVIGGGIDVVERCSGIQEFAPTCIVAPHSHLGEAVHHRIQMVRAVDHGGVDYSVDAGDAGAGECAEDADDEEHAATAEVADEVRGELRRSFGATELVEQSRRGDIAQVVAGLLRLRPALAIAVMRP